MNSGFIKDDLIIGNYIGKGTFSVVYEAVQKSDNTKKFALKKVFASNMEDDKARSDCMNELHILQKLKHPNVISYICYEIAEHGDLYILLELADAGDLCQLISGNSVKEQLIPEKSIWFFSKQISSALEHMHDNRIMHRDLKPANVFLTGKGVIKLGDLGLSKYFSGSTKSAYSILGSPYYMSPERLLHEKYYFSSDIWSLGCIMYELAALRSPFYIIKLDIKLLTKKVITSDYPPIPSDSYSKQLSKVIKMCLSIDETARPNASSIRKLCANYS